MTADTWSLVALGQAMVGGAVAWQIIANWRRHGLTYLRYAPAMLYMIGSGLVAWAALAHHPWIAGFTAAPALVAGAAVYVKVRDRGRSRRWWR